MEPYRILLVEDDATIREMTQLSLQRDGFSVDTAADGPSGLDAFREHPPDLVLLDLMLPGLDGVSVCRAIRESSVVPVVMLTARSDALDVVVGLEAGADDYVTKPFEPAVLAARLRAVLRRATRPEAAAPLRFGTLEIDPLGMVVRRDGEEVSLTPTEYRLLLMLAENAGIVLSRERLLEEVWGYVWAGDTRLVDMHVRRLRGKIGHEAIETVRGAGYKMVRP
ncbi:MAG TPA: response regulator transcription factor [Gaiellales bacterium]|nr:response regulator transcription factor [Gaiellales bacterium]HEX3258293.1 response regulator transcription factor [Pseudonocardia sp.]